MKYVYEFTNKRKVTKREFIRWFQKKFLYTVRKFNMIRKGDIVAYGSEQAQASSSKNVKRENKGDFRVVVLENLLNLLSEKGIIDVVKLSAKRKYTRKAITSTTDTEADKLTNILVNAKVKGLNEMKPVNGKVIKPMFLFLDKEVLLYAELMRLNFKKTKEAKNKLGKFVDELEKKHPEIKHSIVKSYLELL
jgi:hypothetical protein